MGCGSAKSAAPTSEIRQTRTRETKKKPVEDKKTIVQEAPSDTDTYIPIAEINKRIGDLNKRRDELEFKIRQEEEKAQEQVTAGNAARAREHLARKKNYETHLAPISGTILQLEQQAENIDAANERRKVFEVMEKGKAMADQHMVHATAEMVHIHNEEAAEQNAKQKAVGELLGANSGGYDKDIEEQLLQMQKEKEASQANADLAKATVPKEPIPAYAEDQKWYENTQPSSLEPALVDMPN